MAGSPESVVMATGRRRETAHLSAAKRKEVKEIAKRVVNQGKETKHLETTGSAVAVTQTAVLTNLTAIPQGDTVSTRSGDQVKLTRLYGRLNVLQDDGGTGSNRMRFLIIQWKPNNADEAISYSKLFESGTAANIAIDDFVNDKVDRAKFKVLWDKTLLLPPESDHTTNPNKLYKINLFGKKLARKIIYEPTSTNGSGCLFLVHANSQANAADDSAISYRFVAEFKDL